MSGRVKRSHIVAFAAATVTMGMMVSTVGVAGAGAAKNAKHGKLAKHVKLAKGITTAKKALSALEKRPQTPPSTTKIAKTIPSGKTFDWIECSLPTCTVLTPPLEAAAAKLGWTIKVVPAGITPSTVKAAWDVAVRDHPDGIFASGFPKTVFATELKTLSSETVPVVDLAVGTTAGTGLTAVIQGNTTNVKIGQAMADWVVAKKGTKANTLVISSSTFSTLAKVQAAFSSTYKKLCPSCKQSTLNEPATTFGTSLPSAVVAYLKSHPSINYLVPDESAMNIGLPQALASAGLSSRVGIVSQYPSNTTLQYLSSGEMTAIVMPQMTDSMWQMVDAMARALSGTTVKAGEGPSPLWMLTKKSASEVSTPFYLTPTYAKKYSALWGVK